MIAWALVFIAGNVELGMHPSVAVLVLVMIAAVKLGYGLVELERRLER